MKIEAEDIGVVVSPWYTKQKSYAILPGNSILSGGAQQRAEDWAEYSEEKY